MKKLISKISILATFFVICAYKSVFAGNFLEVPYMNTTKWVYITDEGKLAKNTWLWIDYNNDNIAECFYFGNEYWMYAGSMTPDGYLVDKNGCWVVDNVVQQKVLNKNPMSGAPTSPISPSTTSTNVINTIGSKISTDVTRQRNLRNAIIHKKGYEYLDKKKMGDITWSEVIRLNGRESYIVVQPGTNNILEFEAKVYKYNDDVTYTLTVLIGDEEDETYDMGTSAQKIRVEIPDRQFVTILFNSIPSDNVYVSSESRNLYIRNGKLSYKKNLFEE